MNHAKCRERYWKLNRDVEREPRKVQALPGDPVPVVASRSSIAFIGRMRSHLAGVIIVVPADLSNHMLVINQHNLAFASGAPR